MKRWIAAVLCAALLFCMPAPRVLAEQPKTQTAELLNDWVVARAGAMVYRDAEMKRTLGKLSEDRIVKRRVALGSCTAIASGKLTGYVANGALTALKEGDWLCASRDTRAYRWPSLRSRSVGVKKGTAVQLVEIDGTCAKVRRGSVEAYMYIGHLKLQPVSWAVSTGK